MFYEVENKGNMIAGVIGYDSIRKHLAVCGYHTVDVREKYYDQITAIKFWDEVAKIGEKKMVPQWSMSEADKNRLSTFFAIALKHAQGMWNEASGTYAQSITLLNGLSDTDKELLKKEVDIFVACMQNMV